MRMRTRAAMVVLAGLLLVPPVGSGPALAATPGTPWTWGSNSFGELGDGTTANHFTAAPVVGFAAADAVELGGGREHVIALRTDGTVWTWGSSQYGQLGSGGMNAQGQLGDGTTTRRLRPVQVRNLTGVTQIAGGRGHSLALQADGSVWAWGYNAFGELGDGTLTRRTTPVRAGTLTGVVAIAAGAYHSVALLADGTVRSWGRNNLGQLGDGTLTRRTTPVQVRNLTGVSAMTAGRAYTAALVGS